MPLKLRGKRVAVEKSKRPDKDQESFIAMPNGEEYLGVVRYVGEEASKDLKVGQKVYFSTAHQNVRMGGSELCVMDDTSVLAIVED